MAHVVLPLLVIKIKFEVDTMYETARYLWVISGNIILVFMWFHENSMRII